jgi:NhaP-type Na+/H+ or K+/H+ antiporter
VLQPTELITLVVVAVVLYRGSQLLCQPHGGGGTAGVDGRGVGVGAIPSVPHFTISLDLVLTVILPPLLYAVARKAPFVGYRRNLRVIGFLIA